MTAYRHLPEVPSALTAEPPPFRRRALDLSQQIVPLGFQDQRGGPFGFQLNEKIRHGVVYLFIMQIRNGEAKPGILTNASTSSCQSRFICRRLFPLLRVRHHIGEM